MVKTVYLAGPISGLTSVQANDWREYVTVNLHRNINALNPLRGCLTGVDPKEELDFVSDFHVDPMRTSKGIMTRDYYDCTKADMVFVNFLGATKVSIGTVMEVAWCFAHSIPTVVAIEDAHNPHEHAMIKEATGFRVNNLEAGVKIINETLGPYTHTPAPTFPFGRWY